MDLFEMAQADVVQAQWSAERFADLIVKTAICVVVTCHLVVLGHCIRKIRGWPSKGGVSSSPLLCKCECRSICYDEDTYRIIEVASDDGMEVEMVKRVWNTLLLPIRSDDLDCGQHKEIWHRPTFLAQSPIPVWDTEIVGRSTKPRRQMRRIASGNSADMSVKLLLPVFSMK
jgi:hypothetical protein